MQKKEGGGWRIVKILLLCLSGGLFVWFLIPVFRKVLHIGNLTGMAFSFLLAGYVLLVSKLKRMGRSQAVRTLHILAGTAGTAVAAWIVFFTVCMRMGAASSPPEQATVIVLGCQIKNGRPSRSLARRIQAAAAYLREHPEACCVASGGQGHGENQPEAEVISVCLQRAGIAPQRIALETHSTNTRENLQYSLQRIRENGWSTQVALATDAYHQFRAARIARKWGMDPYALPAKTPWYSFSACYGRELLSLTKEFLLG